jgi:UDP-glucose 4-epimerase
VDYVLGDVNDTQLVLKAASDVDSIIYLASTTVPTTANLDPVADVTGNLISILRLLTELRTKTLKKFVFLSSGGTVYGIPETVPISENHPLRPINSYGIVKVAIENYLFMENKLHGLPSLILRASNPYGPRQGHSGIQGIIGTHLWRMAKGEAPEVWGDGSVVRDFIHVADMAELCYVALTSDQTGCFNAGSGEGTSIADLLTEMQKVVSETSGLEVKTVYKPGRSFDVPKVVLDVSKAKNLLGWQPRIGLTEGLRDNWQWVREEVTRS